MTIKQVKKDLPRVLVRIGHKVHTGRVTGRLNNFPTVTVLADKNASPVGPFWWDYHFSWAAVARAITNGTPLIV